MPDISLVRIGRITMLHGTSRLRWWQRVAEAGALLQAQRQTGQVRMQRAPVEIGKAEVEVAQAATDADVGNAVAVGAAPVALAEVVREGGQAADNLVVLAVDPVGALQCRRAALLDHDIGGGIADAIGQRPISEKKLRKTVRKVVSEQSEREN